MRLSRLETEVMARSDESKRLLQLMDEHRAEELAIRDTANNVYSEMEVYKAAAENHLEVSYTRLNECDRLREEVRHMISTEEQHQLRVQLAEQQASAVFAS